MNTLPDVLHVGFSKCASTFLQAFFEGHPEIYLVNQSHFFAPFEFSSYDAGKEDYSRLFQNAKSNQIRLESDEHIILPLFHPVLSAAATTLSAVTEVSARIKAIQPGARIVIVIRNQIDLIVSRYSEYVLGGGTGDFELFVTEFLKCSTDGVNYYQNYYSRIIEVFQHDFGADNVLVLLQEELAADEKGIIERLCLFLGVRVLQPRRNNPVSSRRVGLSSLGIAVMRAINRGIVIRQEMSHKKTQVKIPYLAYKITQRSIRMLDYYLPKRLKGDKSSILTEMIQSRIRDEFADDNLRLAALLGKDLRSLGY
jgi:hypothetical protein